MVSGSQIKLIKSLQLKKYRKKYALFTVEGLKPVNEVLRSLLQVEAIYTIKGLESKLKKPDPELPVFQMTEKENKRISALKTPPGILAVVTIPGWELTGEILNQPWSLCLDRIRDPGNLGTIIRTACWFGLPAIFCSPGCADAYNPKVVQSAMGGLFQVKVFYRQLEKLLVRLKKPVYAASPEGKPLAEVNPRKEGTIVVGNESEGISRKIMEKCGEKIMIPRVGEGESLNVSVAAGILLYEFTG